MDEYSELNNYSYPPIMPGIRRLAGVPEARHKVNYDFEGAPLNFVPSHLPQYGTSRYGVPVMLPENGRMALEGFGAMSKGNRFLVRLAVFLLIIGLVCYLVGKKQ